MKVSSRPGMSIRAEILTVVLDSTTSVPLYRQSDAFIWRAIAEIEYRKI